MITDKDSAPLKWLVISSRDARQHIIARCNGIADAVVDFILASIKDLGAKDVAISIETPVYNGNPAIFYKQLYLLSLIETYLWFIMSSADIESCSIHLPNPTTSKSLSTGNGKAEKSAIIAVSPFATMNTDTSEDLLIVETLADSWAHSLSARDPKAHSVFEAQVVRPVILCEKR